MPLTEPLQESVARKVDLPEDNLVAVGALLDWLYTDSKRAVVRIFDGEPGDFTRSLLGLARLADKFDQPILLEEVLKVLIVTDTRLQAADIARGVRTMRDGEVSSRVRQS
jgi:hypothetical protein